MNRDKPRITYAKEEGLKLLIAARIRRGQPEKWGDHTYTGPAEVRINGTWLKLVRTDLKDDVCTSYQGEGELDLEEYRAVYIKRIRYGVRVTRGFQDTFACIDSFSDG